MTPAFVHTTEPVPVPGGGWQEHYERLWHGTEPPGELSPGLHAFRGRHHRRHAALYHNAALEAGYTSELESTQQFSHVHVSAGR